MLIDKMYYGAESTVDNLFKEILNFYDGYSWDGDTSVINPHSLLSFLKYNSFKNYWNDSSDPSFIRELDLRQKDYFTLFEMEDAYYGKIEATDVGNATPESLLLQAGYLTVGKEDRSRGVRIFNLVLPNKEINVIIVKEFFFKLIFPEISNAILGKIEYIKLHNAICDHDGVKTAKILAGILSTIPFSIHEDIKKYYHIIIFLTLSFAEKIKTAEFSFSDSRADIVMDDVDKNKLIVEIKYLKESDIFKNDTVKPSPEFWETDEGPADQASRESRESWDSRGTRAVWAPWASAQTRKAHAAQEALEDAGADRPAGSGEGEGPAPAPAAPVAGTADGYGSFLSRMRVISGALDKAVNEAFERIEEKGYAVPYFAGNGNPCSVAIAICGRSFTRVRFEKCRRPVTLHQSEA
jgi:hypothetical protein